MEILSDTKQAEDCGRTPRRNGFRIWEVVGILVSLPAAVAAVCVAGRVDLSAVPLATVSIFFLVSLASALGGILASFGMRSAPLVWGVRLVGAGWLGLCAWAVGQFVLHMASFSH